MDAIEACVSRHYKKLDSEQRVALLVSLRAIPVFVRRHIDSVVLEKERKRQIDKVRTNAVRLVTALDELDREARDYVAYCMMSGDPEAEEGYERIMAELRSLTHLIDLTNHLRSMATAKPDKLPFQWNERPELLIAADLVNALRIAGIDVSTADNGAAADCFYAVADAARIEPKQNARYWLKKALCSPYV